jgi:hypothetical protein
MPTQERNNQEFKFLVSGPYNPIEIIDEEYKGETFKYINRPVVATARTAIDIATTYWSHLMHSRHLKNMTEAHRHAAVMMGEVDEPGDEGNEPTYNPLFEAGFIAMSMAIQGLRTAMNRDYDGKRVPKLIEKSQLGTTAGVIVQLLFALADDVDGMANCIRYAKTGYLGARRREDEQHIDEYRKFIRSIFGRADQINEAIEDWRIDIPLQAGGCYDMKANKYYWSAPILVPQFKIENDE